MTTPQRHPLALQDDGAGPPRTLRIVIVWMVLATLLFLGFQWWLSQQQRARFSVADGVVTLQRSRDGHFHWPGNVNGVNVDFLVDTGATRTALPPDVARLAGLQGVGKSRSSTAGGDVDVIDVLADIQLQGGTRAERLRVGVLQKLDTPLLGMDVLGKLAITQQGGEMRIARLKP